MNSDLCFGVLLPEALQKLADSRHNNNEQRNASTTTSDQGNNNMDTNNTVVSQRSTQPTRVEAPSLNIPISTQQHAAEETFTLGQILAERVKVTVALEAPGPKSLRDHAVDVGKGAASIAVAGGVLYGLYSIGCLVGGWISGDDTANDASAT
jgi:hypothetical protein